jgi:hypothetical protein
VIDSVGWNLVELLAVPRIVVTAILPVTAPLGTTAFSCVPETNVTDGEASAPNFTFASGAKCVPLIVTVLPVIPSWGLNEPQVGFAYA